MLFSIIGCCITVRYYPHALICRFVKCYNIVPVVCRIIIRQFCRISLLGAVKEAFILEEPILIRMEHITLNDSIKAYRIVVVESILLVCTIFVLDIINFKH